MGLEKTLQSITLPYAFLAQFERDPMVKMGNCYSCNRKDINLLVLNPLPRLWVKLDTNLEGRSGCVRMFLTVSKMSYKSFANVSLLSFCKSNLDEFEGPHYCWLNKVEGSNNFYVDRVLLVFSSASLEDSLKSSCDHIIMFEKVNSLQ